jgi:MFS family permease
MMSGFIIAAIFTILSSFFIFPFRSNGFEITYFLFILVTLFQWTGLSMGVGSFTGLVPQVIPENKLGFAGICNFNLAGVLGVSKSFGNLTSVLITGLLVQYLPYPFNFIGAYLYLSIVFLFTMSYTFITIPESKPEPSNIEEEKKPITLKNVLSYFWLSPKEYKNFYLVFASRFFFEMGTYGIVTFITVISFLMIVLFG